MCSQPMRALPSGLLDLTGCKRGDLEFRETRVCHRFSTKEIVTDGQAPDT